MADTVIRVGRRRPVKVRTLAIKQAQVLLTTWIIDGWPADVPLPKEGEAVAVLDAQGKLGPLRCIADKAARFRGSILIQARRRKHHTIPVEEG